MNDWIFAEQKWIHALWGVAAFVALLIYFDRRVARVLDQFVSRIMQGTLVTRPRSSRRVARLTCLGSSCCCLVLALMRPQWGVEFVRTPRAGAELLICLDVSRSMLAEDGVGSSRLDRARQEIRDLLTFMQGDHVGLIAFAGRASVVCPLTPDFGFFRMVLDQLTPNSVGLGGTNLSAPIDKALEGFGAAGDVSRAILLITDGEDHGFYPEDAAKRAAQSGVTIIPVGFGSESGSEITYTNEKGAVVTVTDPDGNTVMSRLDSPTLIELAELTDSIYIPAGTSALDLRALYDQRISPLTRGNLDGTDRTVRKEGFQWFVLASLLFLFASAALSGGARRPRLMLSATPQQSRKSNGSSSSPNKPKLASALLVALAFLLTLSTAAAQSPAVNGSPDPKLPHADESGTEDGASAAEDTIGSPSDIPDDAREAYNVGVVALNEGALARAKKLFESARDNAGTDGRTRFSATYNLGWVQVKEAETKLLLLPQPQPGKTLRQAIGDDEELLTQAKQALEAYQEAKGWFRSALDLRSGSEESRHNLEIITERAFQLEDSLREVESFDLQKSLDQLIEQQRALVASSAVQLEQVVQLEQGVKAESSADSAAGNLPGVSSESPLRRAYRDLASRQRVILSSAAKLSDQCALEEQSVSAKAEDQRTPEEAMRLGQLQGVVHYLHQARERMGKARRQLKRVQGERGYRRTSLALTELKRARDQLREPLELLKTLLKESNEVLEYTRKLELSQGTPGVPPPPRWLSVDWLTETETGVAQRVGELTARLELGLEQMDAQGSDPHTSDATTPDAAAAEDPAVEKQRQAIAAALPHLRRGTETSHTAASQLESNQLAPAHQSISEAVVSLIRAQDAFLDLKGLIDTVASTHAVVQTVMSTPLQSMAMRLAQMGYRFEDLGNELANSTLLNVERSARIDTLLDESLAELDSRDPATDPTADPTADPTTQQPQETQQAQQQERQRLLYAKQLLAVATAALNKTQERLPEVIQQEWDELPEFANTQEAVDDAAEQLKLLRRLFFTLIEHLQETAQRQQEVCDQTQELLPLATTADPALAGRLGPLQPRQQELQAISGEIAKALEQQGGELQQAPPQGGAPLPDPEKQEKFRQAAELVFGAEAELGNAVAAMQKVLQSTTSAPSTAPSTASSNTQSSTAQNSALVPNDPSSTPDAASNSTGGTADPAAVGPTAADPTAADPKGMQTPPQPLSPVREPQDKALSLLREALALLQPPQDPDQQQQQQQQQDPQQQPQPQPGEDEQQSQQQSDPAKLLQSVLDREAKRRAEKERAPTRAQPVEKDW